MFESSFFILAFVWFYCELNHSFSSFENFFYIKFLKCFFQQVFVDMQQRCPDLHELFSWCDPTINRNLEDHLLVFEKVSAVVDNFLSNHVLK